jgi:hypothetical protein
MDGISFMKTDLNITSEHIRELLSYDSDSGILMWGERRQGRKANVAAGSVRKDGRIALMIDGRWYKAHRLAWLHVYGEWPTEHLDHINGNPADNRICNLRESTVAQNAQNRCAKKSNKSGFLGVSWSVKMQKWQAGIEVDGKGRHLGYWDTPQQASMAYSGAKRELHKFNPEVRHGI